MSEFKTDGYVITNGESSMGIFSATLFLNDVIKRLNKLGEESDKLKKENKILRECINYYANETTDIIAVRARRVLEALDKSDGDDYE